MGRIYKIISRSRSKILREYHITDAKNDNEMDDQHSEYRLPRVILPVNGKYDSEPQLDLAYKIVNYLNEVIKVQEDAVEHIKLT